ncbi:MAG: hypothetical protein IT393_12265 [Nitrospirae bacterium]|nr:hypothetical protein [Nitrospirota bacterium]
MKFRIILFIAMMVFVLDWTGLAGESIDASIDKELKSIWSSMITRLSSGDIEGALEYFTDASRWKYKDQFILAGDKLTELAAGMAKIDPVYIKVSEAQYRIRTMRPDDGHTYYIWFRRDKSGNWKIDRF